MPDNDKEIAIKVEHLSKSFKIPLEKSNGLKQKLINTIKGKKGYRVFTPLENISFEIDKGEFFGIVGRNGSGKSTLLKSIAGIYTPNKGRVQVNGMLIPFIELGVGFNAELSGRENVFLNGALLGFSRADMEEMYDDIVEFAELEDFMDESLKNYSSGMQVRLAFSIAIRAKGDILLLDEVLAVGDASFQRKCFEYFAHLKKNKKTVILVTHSMESVQQFCDRALMLNDGEIIAIGKPSKIAKVYTRLNRPQAKFSNTENDQDLFDDNELLASFKVDVLVDGNPKKASDVISGGIKSITFKNSISVKEDILDAFFAFTIRKQSGELIYWHSTEESHPDMKIEKNKGIHVDYEIDNIFGEGMYEVGIYIKSKDRSKEYVEIDNAYKFTIVDRGPNGYMLHPRVKVNVC